MRCRYVAALGEPVLALPRRLCRSAAFSFEARGAETIVLGLPLLGLFFGHFPNDAGCLVQRRFHSRILCFEHA